MKAKVTPKNIFAFLQGNFRYFFYYSKYFKWVIPKYVREQIDFRIKSMRKSCYEKGECEECGCKTTHLQMANKTCGGICYPSMLKKKDWDYCKKYGHVLDCPNSRLWKIEDGKFVW